MATELPPPIVAAAETVQETTETVQETAECFAGGELNVSGLVAIIVFYVAVLLVGVWASWRTRKAEQNTEQVMLAGRDIGLFVGVLTMGATWVGGGFINGSAQETYSAGLIWTQAPFGYGLSLIISGTFFARKMREAEYVTMIDPFTQKFGKFGALQALPAAVSEIFWSASILGALGSTLQVVLNIPLNASIIMSAVIALGYTLLGGLISVAYTDVIQIFFIVFGLFLALPFAMQHESVGNLWEQKIANTTVEGGPLNYEIGEVGEEGPIWYGSVKPHLVGVWVDYVFLLLFGGEWISQLTIVTLACRHPVAVLLPAGSLQQDRDPGPDAELRRGGHRSHHDGAQRLVRGRG